MRLKRLLCSSIVVALLACQGSTAELPAEEPSRTHIPDELTPPPSPPSEPAPEHPSEPPAPPDPVTPRPPPPSEPPEVERRFVLPPVQQALRDYVLEMPPEVWARFLADKSTPEQDAVFRVGDETYPVKVRLRGASARDFPKKSWNVSFPKDRPFEGRTSLNLVAGYSDATMLAEKMAFDLLEALRVPASKAKFVRLRINGQFEGVFLDIEQVNKAFLRDHAFADTDASIYRAGWKDTELKLRSWKVPYQGDWQKKTNEKESDEALDAVLYVINRTPEPQLPGALARHLELEGYLRCMVMDALMANNYIEDSESYFIHDRVKDRWVYVPWDLNNVDARWWHEMPLEPNMLPLYRHPLFAFTLPNPKVASRYAARKDIHPGYLPVFSNLATRVVTHPELKARLVARLDKALRELFTLEVMGPYIDQLHALLAPDMANDPYMDPAKFQAGRDFMRDYVRLRRQFIQKELERHRTPAPGVVLEALDAREGWVELRNRGSTPVELGGMVLTTHLRRSLPALLTPEGGAPVGTLLPEGTLAPGASMRFMASDLGLPLTPDGELGLFDGQSVTGVKDLLFYGPLPAGKHYARSPEGDWRTR